MTRFKEGATLPQRGLRLLKAHPRLWLWLIVPWLIDLAVLLVGWVQGLIFIQTSTAAMITSWLGGGWLFTALYYPAVLIFGLAFLIFWVVVVVSVAAVVAAPFTSILVEKALKRQGVTTSAFRWHMLKTTLVKAVIFACAGVIFFVVSFVPGVNLAAGYASMCIFAADCFDYSFEALGFNWSRRWREMKYFGVEIAGLGASLALTSVIPGLTVFAMPVAALGASTLVGRPKS